MTHRLRTAAPVLASAGLAGLTALVLALRLAPRYDELHTLAYLQDPDLRSLWRSYRSVGDTLPPVGYAGWWAWSRVAGDSLVAVRLPSVAAWAAAAGAVTGLTRRTGAWASFAAGLLATASGLVYLGPFARPYAVAVAAVAAALWCVQRSVGSRRATGWLVASGALWATASALHYAAAAAAVIAALVIVVGGRSRARAVRAATIGAAGLAPVLLSAGLIPRAANDQGRLGATAGPADALGFWPSTLRPGAVPLVALLVVVGAAAVWPGAGRRCLRSRLLDRDLLRTGLALAVVVPAATVAAMAVTSGTYLHRYAFGALVGGAVVLAEAVGRAVRRWSWIGPLAAVALLTASVLAVRSAEVERLSRTTAHDLPIELGLAPGPAPVVVLDEYDYLLLRSEASPAVAERLRLGADPVVAHSPDPVEVEAIGAGGRGVLIIGTPSEIERLVSDGGWRSVELGRTSYPRPEAPQVLVLARVELDP